MVLNLPDQTDFLYNDYNLGRNTCIPEPREAWARPIKCWDGRLGEKCSKLCD